MPEIERDRELLIAAVRDAGALAAKYFRNGAAHWEKSPGDPISEADLAVDRLLQQRLRSARPDYGWLSEEAHEDRDTEDRRRVWVVDPIDGTRAFVKGRAEFAVSAALIDAGEVTLGAVYDPVGERFFFAARGAGASLNEAPIRPSDRADLAGCQMLADRDLLRAWFWPEPWPEMKVAKPNSMALRLALVASGAADATITLRAKSDWDIAAASLILKEAGAIFTDAEGTAIEVSGENGKHPVLIATAPALHEPVRKRVAEAVARRRRGRSGKG